jgi:quercetin dioxygenase-like cupin family protein
MLAKLLWSVLLAAVIRMPALAQDPIKVEPTHYRLAFDNDRVQVVYIHYGPHEKSSLHSHPQGVVVNVSEGHLRFTSADGQKQEVFAKAGEARWFPPFRHMVENLGDKAYDGVYIGIKAKPAVSATVEGEKNQSRELASVFDERIQAALRQAFIGLDAK